ncbi:hypothetical protein [Paludisphaera soli]|uniref:hypothetical protein n=1 Tax=Paludisphaera soli TaxID=2712865 RepID=UPI0013EC229C|nr:hypothetical protein [Paludisphaera soli]
MANHGKSGLGPAAGRPGAARKRGYRRYPPSLAKLMRVLNYTAIETSEGATHKLIKLPGGRLWTIARTSEGATHKLVKSGVAETIEGRPVRLVTVTEGRSLGFALLRVPSGGRQAEVPGRDAGEEMSPVPATPDRSQSYDWSRGVPAGYAGALSEELAVYAANLDRLLENEGDYVLIRKSEICGVFPERGDAEEEGLRRFGDVPVLIKRIARHQPLVFLGGAAR